MEKLYVWVANAVYRSFYGTVTTDPTLTRIETTLILKRDLTLRDSDGSSETRAMMDYSRDWVTHSRLR